MKELGENKQLKILVITNNYPTIHDPVNGTFVRQFIHAMVDNGVDAVVIRPIRVLEIRKRKLPAPKTIDMTPNGNRITVYYPKFISFSWKNMGFFHTGWLTQYNFFYAARTIVKKMDFKPDVVYGHFFTPAGFSAVKLGKMLNAFSVIRVGESFSPSQKVLWSLRHLSRKKAITNFRGVGGIIANSSHLKKFIVNYLEIPEKKILVCSNGIDLSRFRPMDKNLVRRKLSIPEDKFTIIFIGAPTKRKGYPILMEALSRLEDVYGIFLGNGMKEVNFPKNIQKKIIFKGEVEHNEVPLWLNASDVFVLPTLSEGSSNATIEAMACGLPIITDKGSHMDDVVGDKTAIRVNSESVEEVTLAIKKLKDNPKLREKLSFLSLERSKRFDLNQKAQRVIRWIRNRMEDNEIL